MTMFLDGKVAIVTGAGRGIGRGHALELARHGAKVVVNDLGGSADGVGRSAIVDEVVERIVAAGGSAVADYGDVSNEADAEGMIARAYDEWGRLDVLVNNAGVIRDGMIWDLAVEDFDVVMRVHVRGTWLTCRAAARRWRERAESGVRLNARIINTTSGVGLGGNIRETNYAAAKAAIVGMTQALNLELRDLGVTCNAIGPAGSTRISAALPTETFDGRETDDYHTWDPDDPANSSPLVAWLASDESALVSGQVFRVPKDRIVLMDGWREAGQVLADARWDATTLGTVLAEEVFGLRHLGWPRSFTRPRNP